MILIPKAVYAQYLNYLKKNNITADQHQEYVKWLRYFLDFCAKHVIVHEKSERLQLFLKKLREKNQSDDQRLQAANAVTNRPRPLFAVQKPIRAISQLNTKKAAPPASCR